MKATIIRTPDGYTFYRVKQGDAHVWVDSLDPNLVDMTCEDKDGHPGFAYLKPSDVTPMEWRDSGEGPFDTETDAEDYVASEFHTPTRIRETSDGWVIETLTTRETS